jgi:hypothetical protein
MAEEGELPRESSLSIEGQSPWGELPCCESEDPDLGGAAAMGGEEESLGPQESARSEWAEEPRLQQMGGCYSHRVTP